VKTNFLNLSKSIKINMQVAGYLINWMVVVVVVHDEFPAFRPTTSCANSLLSGVVLSSEFPFFTYLHKKIGKCKLMRAKNSKNTF